VCILVTIDLVRELFSFYVFPNNSLQLISDTRASRKSYTNANTETLILFVSVDSTKTCRPMMVKFDLHPILSNVIGTHGYTHVYTRVPKNFFEIRKRKIDDNVIKISFCVSAT